MDDHGASGEPSMNFAETTAAYEKWLAKQLTLIPQDLALKHKAMKADLFSFFRATFYRWAQLYPQICDATAPQVLAVGDLHVENFGTWRDSEGRLTWGVNDFDEVARMPYTIDLVRLAASAHIAIEAEHLQIALRDACGSILKGYRESLESGGCPWVIAGHHPWLRDMVNPGLRDPILFWEKLITLQRVKGSAPKTARRAIEKLMPARSLEYNLAHRIAGLGSLGRQRFVGVAEFEGGLVCREAKALAPSAWEWANGKRLSGIHYQRALDISVRDRDPFVRVKDGWIVRRLAPDCTRIEMSMFPKQRDETRLLHAMGWEIGNLHLGSGSKVKLLADLKKRGTGWLHRDADRMVKATRADWTSQK
jgi:hypothetical protein